MENENNKNLSYLVPIGGAIGLLCFFTPWIGCNGQEASGYDLTKEKGEFWLVLVGAVLILGSYFLHNYNSKSEEETKPYKIAIIISAIVSSVIMLFYFIKMKSGNMGNYIEVKFGAVLSLLGYIGSIIGAVYLTPMEVMKNVIKPKLFCSNCGASYKSESSGSFCENCGEKL